MRAGRASLVPLAVGLLVAALTGCGPDAPTLAVSQALPELNDGGDDRDPALTPGHLCTPDDPDFEEYRYAERVPYCRRRVTTAQKRAVGEAYGVDPADFSQYQFDHFIPLSFGGSNRNDNLWPLLFEAARRKARVEQQLYLRLTRGEITQSDAIAAIHAWR